MESGSVASGVSGVVIGIAAAASEVAKTAALFSWYCDLKYPGMFRGSWLLSKQTYLKELAEIKRCLMLVECEADVSLRAFDRISAVPGGQGFAIRKAGNDRRRRAPV